MNPKGKLWSFRGTKKLTFEKFIAWTKSSCMRSTDIDVFLPRFLLDRGYDMALVNQSLEIANAFQWDKADFSSMSVRKELFLTNVVHQIFLEVNEEGSEAAAASDMDLAIDYCGVTLVRSCADHPFLFFIRHNKANCILFCGRFFLSISGTVTVPVSISLSLCPPISLYSSVNSQGKGESRVIIWLNNWPCLATLSCPCTNHSLCHLINIIGQ